MPSGNFRQAANRQSRQRTGLANFHCREHIAVFQFDHRPDSSVGHRPRDGLGNLNVGVEHDVDAVKRAPGRKRDLQPPPRRRRRIVVSVVAHPGYFEDVGIDRIDQRAGYHVDFVVFRQRDNRVGRGDSGRFENLKVVAVGLHNRAVKLVARVPHTLGIVVDKRDAVFFGNQRLRQGNAGESCSYDEYFHDLGIL